MASALKAENQQPQDGDLNKMPINVSLIQEYCNLNGWVATTNITCDEEGNTIIAFVKGDSPYGKKVEYLSHIEMIDILILNKVLGDNGIVAQEQLHMDPSRETGMEINKRLKNIEFHIYDTLSKYIYQMLCSTGKVHYPELIPLPTHKHIYFTEVRREASENVR